MVFAARLRLGDWDHCPIQEYFSNQLPAWMLFTGKAIEAGVFISQQIIEIFFLFTTY